jgi:transcriptional activator of cad operon
MIYIFNDVEVDTELVVFTKNKNALEIEPKLFSLLVYLCQNPNRAISRDELINTVWGNRFVSEAAINRAIGQLRKHIEDDTAQPKYIRTVSKVGYRLDADVQHQHSMHSQCSPEAARNHKTSPIPAKVVIITASVLVGILLLLFTLLKFASPALAPSVSIENMTPITSSSNISFNPHFDNANNELLYLFKENGRASAQIKSLNSQHKTLEISQDNYYYTDVAPLDEERVIASRLTDLEQRHCEIVTVNKMTHETQKITNCGKSIIKDLVFDKAANMLYYRFRNNVSHPYAIYSISLASFRIQQLSRPVSTGNGLGHTVFALSPNTHQLAMVEYQGEAEDELQVFDLQTQQIIQRHIIPKGVHSVLYRSPSLLLLASSEGLYSLDLTRGQLTPESKVEFGKLAFKGDNEIVFEKFYFQSNLLQIPLDATAQTHLTELIGVNGNASIAHHSDTAIFFAITPQSSAIKLRHPNGEILDSQFPETVRHVANFDWFDDDNQLVASVNSQLYILNVNNMKWHRLAVDFKTIHHVSVIDGEQLLFSAEKNSDWNLWTLNLTTHTLTLMTETEGYSGQVYKDTLYYTKFSTPGLFYKDIATANEQVLLPDFAVTQWNNWQIIEGTLIYRQAQQLMQYDLNNNNTTVLFDLSNKPIRACKVNSKLSKLICELQQHSVSNIWQADIRQ